MGWSCRFLTPTTADTLVPQLLSLTSGARMTEIATLSPLSPAATATVTTPTPSVSTPISRKLVAADTLISRTVGDLSNRSRRRSSSARPLGRDDNEADRDGLHRNDSPGVSYSGAEPASYCSADDSTAVNGLSSVTAGDFACGSFPLPHCGDWTQAG
jgi:hypothetical protein